MESEPASATGTSPNNRLAPDAGWSSLTRSGRWDIPPFLLLDGAKSTLKVDCLQATPLAEIIDIEVVASMGRVTVVIPESWAAHTDPLVPSWGVAQNKVYSQARTGSARCSSCTDRSGRGRVTGSAREPIRKPQPRETGCLIAASAGTRALTNGSVAHPGQAPTTLTRTSSSTNSGGRRAPKKRMLRNRIGSAPLHLVNPTLA